MHRDRSGPPPARIVMMRATALRALLCGPRLGLRVWVSISMTVVALLIAALAIGTPTTRSVHPDEGAHLACYRYYLQHAMPPAIGDPAALPAVTVQGWTYLFEWDMVYDLAAKWARTVARPIHSDVLAARSFNVAAWCLLVVLALRGGVWPLVLAVGLLSPQVWYVFGYFNGDAVPLTLALICVGLVARRDGAVARFVAAGTRPGWAVVSLVLTLGLLLISKRNFVPVILAVAMWLMLQHLRPRAWIVILILAAMTLLGTAVQIVDAPQAVSAGLPRLTAVGGVAALLVAAAGLLRDLAKHPERRAPAWRIAALLLAAALVAAPRIGVDIALNGMPATKAAELQDFAQLHAGPGFRPSDVAHGVPYASWELAKQGVGFGEMLLAKHWPGISAGSMFGVYGYMDVWSPTWLLLALLANFVLLLLLVTVVAWRRQDADTWRQWLVVVGCMFLVVWSSALHSWVGDFQPQGRYLLPMLPIVALLLPGLRAGGETVALRFIVAVGTVLGLGSFIFVALPAFI